MAGCTETVRSGGNGSLNRGDGKWVNNRLLKERKKQAKWKRKCSDGGKKAATTRDKIRRANALDEGKGSVPLVSTPLQVKGNSSSSSSDSDPYISPCEEQGTLGITEPPQPTPPAPPPSPFIPASFCKTELETRLATWCRKQYRWGETRKWSEKMIAMLREIATRDDLVQEALDIGEARKCGWTFGRNDLATLLNNWDCEVDRAREFLGE